MDTLEGIDVSNYQGVVDWTAVARSGRSFAMAKASEGTGFFDPTFERNWIGMQAANLVRGAYHFLHPVGDGAYQADVFHKFVHDSGRFQPGDFIVLDLEVMDKQTPTTVAYEAARFVQRCRQEIQTPVFLYTYPSFWRALGPVAANNHVLTTCPLWLAAYEPAQDLTTLPGWPHGLSFWQYSSTATVPGVNGQCDVDRFFGTKTQLHALAARLDGAKC